jgi:hypothetical protein
MAVEATTLYIVNHADSRGSEGDGTGSLQSVISWPAEQIAKVLLITAQGTLCSFSGSPLSFVLVMGGIRRMRLTILLKERLRNCS